MYVASGNGSYISCCSNDHTPAAGEVLFDDFPTPAQLATAFPGYAAAALAQAQDTQIYAVSAGCASAIIGGFQSSALGAVYTYPSGQTDQANLVGLVAGGIGGKFWCADASGNWGYVAHTAPQILKVLQDGSVAKEALVVQNSVLAAEICAATTEAAVQAVVWTLPS
jgi:hypothetical protein